MPSPALRSRTVPSPNLQVTDGSQEGLHTANIVQALIERGREEREDSSGRKLARKPADAFELSLGVGRAEVPEFVLFSVQIPPLSGPGCCSFRRHGRE